MSAGNVLFTIEIGATFTRTLKWKDRTGVPINLAGYTADMQLRSNVASETILIELSTTNGKITFTEASGEIHLKIPTAETSTITWDTAVFDLLLTDSGGDTIRLIEGTFTSKKGVTR
jgi:hypothetical protein